MARRTMITATSTAWTVTQVDEENREPRYTVTAAATLAGLDPRTLHRYERIGLVVPARVRGRPAYSEADVARARRVRRLIDDLGVNLAGVEVILHMREQLLRLQRELDLLRDDLSR